MKKYHFATVGRLAKEFKQLVDLHYSDQLRCEVFDDDQQLASEIQRFNSLAAFSLPTSIPLSNIEWIHSFGAGVDGMLSNDSLSSNCLVTRTQGNMGIKMGEYCLAYILYDLKQITKALENQHNKIWKPLPLKSLSSQRVLIFGTGNIGSGIAEILTPLCDQVDGFNSSGAQSTSFSNTFNSLDDVKPANYNVVINTLPLTIQTHQYFNQAFFQHFSQILFINVGRGQSVSNNDLLEAVDQESVRHAVLDVFDVEPLPGDHLFWNHPKITITPHHASKTTAKDLQTSFSKVVKALRSNTKSNLIVDRHKAY